MPQLKINSRIIGIRNGQRRRWLQLRIRGASMRWTSTLTMLLCCVQCYVEIGNDHKSGIGDKKIY